jgi:hypothetical protein
MLEEREKLNSVSVTQPRLGHRSVSSGKLGLGSRASCPATQTPIEAAHRI